MLPGQAAARLSVFRVPLGLDTASGMHSEGEGQTRGAWRGLPPAPSPVSPGLLNEAAVELLGDRRNAPATGLG